MRCDKVREIMGHGEEHLPVDEAVMMLPMHTANASAGDLPWLLYLIE